jgi:SprT protein
VFVSQISILKPYLPKKSVPLVLNYLSKWNVFIKISSKRYTKHGDFRILSNEIRQISINKTPNKYRFLITLIHELSHLAAYEKYGLNIKPHGNYWKKTFKGLIKPFLIKSIFPDHLLILLFDHFKNPKASSDSDFDLSIALSKYDENDGKRHIFELEKGSAFEIYNGKKFIVYEKRFKRYLCQEIYSKKRYLFNASAKVKPILIY